MYFSSYSELSYRDSLITAELQTADQNAWTEASLKDATAATADLSKTKLDLVISG